MEFSTSHLSLLRSFPSFFLESSSKKTTDSQRSQLLHPSPTLEVDYCPIRSISFPLARILQPGRFDGRRSRRRRKKEVEATERAVERTGASNEGERSERRDIYDLDPRLRKEEKETRRGEKGDGLRRGEERKENESELAFRRFGISERASRSQIGPFWTREISTELIFLNRGNLHRNRDSDFFSPQISSLPNSRAACLHDRGRTKVNAHRFPSSLQLPCPALSSASLCPRSPPLPV